MARTSILLTRALVAEAASEADQALILAITQGTDEEVHRAILAGAANLKRGVILCVNYAGPRKLKILLSHNAPVRAMDLCAALGRLPMLRLIMARARPIALENALIWALEGRLRASALALFEACPTWHRLPASSLGLLADLLAGTRHRLLPKVLLALIPETRSPGDPAP